MSEMMRAGVASENGLTVQLVARPQPASEQILVRVVAAGMNRADLNAAKGAGVAGKDSWGKPIGMEWAGKIVAVGDGVRAFKPGEFVMCSGTGGYAEYAVADMGRTISLDGSNLVLEHAAALPLALMTAHDAVITNGRLRSGEAVLVQGASSAVGLAALQIAKKVGASLVIATSTSATRSKRLAAFGADLVLDPSDPSWVDQVLKATDGQGANVIIDMVSGATVNGSMRAAAVLARMVNVGRLGGVKTEFDLDLHSLKRLNYMGTTFRTRNLAEVREIVRVMRADLWEAIVSGKIELPVDRIFPLDEAAAAHAYMASNAHFGKIVLKP
jgi:NADPH2:quinone reductase